MMFSFLRNSASSSFLATAFMFAASVLSSTANAFDIDNSGEFAIIHRNGQVTDLTLRISRQADQWKVQNRNEQGTWQDIGCQGDCQLVESNKEEIAYFMGGEEPNDMSTQCIHNVAYALCRVDIQGEKLPQYLFIALVAPPTAVSLVRVLKSGQAPNLISQ